MADKVEVFCRISPDDGTPSPGWCCSFSPCGGYIAIGQANGKIAIWDCLTRGVARNVDISFSSTFTTIPGTSRLKQHSSDSKSNSTCILGRKRPRLAPEYLEAPVTCVAWSCDSKTLLCGSASMTWVLASVDTDSGCVLRFFDFGRSAGDPYPVTVLYHPTRTTDAIVALSDGSVLLLDTLTGGEKYYKVTEERRARVSSAALMPPLDGVSLNCAASTSTTTTTTSSTSSNSLSDHHNLTTSNPSNPNKSTPVVHRNNRALAVTPDGKLVFIGGDATIDVYDSSSRRKILSHNTMPATGSKKKAGRSSSIVSLTLDSTGQLLVANLGSRCLRVFGIIVEDTQNPSQVVKGDTQQEVRKSVTLIWTGIDLYDAINRTRRIGAPLIVNNRNTGSCIVAGEIDHHKIFVWEASSGKLLRAVSNHWATVQKHLGVVSLASHPTRVFFASCAMDGTICLWCQPSRQDWSVKMQEYVNLDKNVVIHDKVRDDAGAGASADAGAGAGVDTDTKNQAENDSVAKKRKVVPSQEDFEQSVVVDVVSHTNYRTAGAEHFFLRSDPPDMKIDGKA